MRVLPRVSTPRPSFSVDTPLYWDEAQEPLEDCGEQEQDGLPIEDMAVEFTVEQEPEPVRRPSLNRTLTPQRTCGASDRWLHDEFDDDDDGDVPVPSAHSRLSPLPSADQLADWCVLAVGVGLVLLGLIRIQ